MVPTAPRSERGHAADRLKRANRYMGRMWMLYLMLVLPIAFFVTFRYVPMTNLVVAFKEFNMFRSVSELPWVGLKWFEKAFRTRDFRDALFNTFKLNILDLVVGFPMPILIALLLNEVAFKRFKRVTQTIAYMPHFLSWITISGLALQLFAPNTGMVNILLGRMGHAPIGFLTEGAKWVRTYIGLGLWQSAGWNTIIYLAAITAINSELYEAAAVDGAGRFRKMWHVTLPGLRPTIVVLLIMQMGRILGSEFDRPYAMRNSLVTSHADVISTYVYRVGIRSFQFSLAAAVGLFQSVVCVVFLLGANGLAERIGERGIW